MRCKLTALVTAVALSMAVTAHAAWILEIDTDHTTVGNTVAYNSHFSFGGDTTGGVGVSAASPAVGMTGGNSIYGGNGGNLPDTYVYTYTPAVDGDNLVLAAGTPLNDNGNVAGGGTAGATGMYTVYATWPRTTNVSGGLTQYTLSDGVGTIFTTTINQNTILDNSYPGPPAPLGGGGEWVPIGVALLNSGTTYSLTQNPTSANTFVSMRAAGILFDPVVDVPEPSMFILTGMAFVGLLARRRNS